MREKTKQILRIYVIDRPTDLGRKVLLDSNISEWEKRRAGFLAGSPAPFVVLGLAVRSWCCPRESAQAGGADCAWWPGAFVL